MQPSPLVISQFIMECLPYIRIFNGKTVVVKYGGHAMTDANLKEAFARNIAMLKFVGVNPVVVHGGGPQIGSMLAQLGIESRFREGYRVTDDATMDVVEMVLVGKVNKEIVNHLNQAGAKAVGLSGKDGRLIQAKKMEMVVRKEAAPPEIIDLGNVGEVLHVDTTLINSLSASGFVPVIAPVGVDEKGHTYNINADAVAAAVAGALKASRLLILTDVPGVLDPAKQLIPSITIDEAFGLFDNGTISGGMIPKIKCCIESIQNGCERVTILDGRVENCVLLELFTDKGVGTQIMSERSGGGLPIPGKQRMNA